MLEAINAFVKQKQNRGGELGDLERSFQPKPGPDSTTIPTLAPLYYNSQNLTPFKSTEEGTKLEKGFFFFW